MLTKSVPNDFQHEMFGLEPHHGAIDWALLFEMDEIGSLRWARMFLESDDVGIQIGSSEFVQNGDS